MTPWPDVVNGLFECVGGLLLWLNVRETYRAKGVRGVSAVPTVVFVAWGYWNLYFYPWANAWVSWVGGMVIVAANTVWLGQMVWYWRRERMVKARLRALSAARDERASLRRKAGAWLTRKAGVQ
jgi:hypothetical protein